MATFPVPKTYRAGLVRPHFRGGRFCWMGDSIADSRLDRVTSAALHVWDIGELGGAHRRNYNSAGLQLLNTWEPNGTILVDETDADPASVEGARFTFQQSDAARRHTYGVALGCTEVKPGTALGAQGKANEWRSESPTASDTFWRTDAGELRTRNPVPFLTRAAARVLYRVCDDPTTLYGGAVNFDDGTGAVPKLLDGVTNASGLLLASGARKFMRHDGEFGGVRDGLVSGGRLHALASDVLLDALDASDALRLRFEIADSTMPSGKWLHLPAPMLYSVESDGGSGYRFKGGHVQVAGAACPSWNHWGYDLDARPANLPGTAAPLSGTGNPSPMEQMKSSSWEDLLDYFDLTCLDPDQRDVVVYYMGMELGEDSEHKTREWYRDRVGSILQRMREGWREFGPKTKPPIFWLVLPNLMYGSEDSTLAQVWERNAPHLEGALQIAHENSDVEFLSMAAMLGGQYFAAVELEGNDPAAALAAFYGAEYDYGAEATIDVEGFAGVTRDTQNAFHPVSWQAAVLDAALMEAGASMGERGGSRARSRGRR